MVDYETPVPELIGQAYEAVRSFNHRTFSGSIIAPEAHRILGEAAALSGVFPQALDQLGKGLRRSLQKFDAYDENRDPALSVEMAAGELAAAAAAFEQIYAYLSAAQSALKLQGVNADDHDRPRREASLKAVNEMECAADALPWDLRRWVTEALAHGYSREVIAQELSELGFAEHVTQAEIRAITSSPIFAVAEEAAARRDKLESLLDALAYQFRRSGAACRVPVMEYPDCDEFFDRYYFGNRPVIVRGLMADWPALGKWTPAWLGENYGDVDIEVTAGRDQDPRFAENFSRHRQTMRLGEFTDAVSAVVGNDCYVVARNNFLAHPALAGLLADLGTPVGFLTSDRDAPPRTWPPRMWLGPAGTVSPLHHDSTNVFFGQVFGTKLIRMIPPFEISNLSSDLTWLSTIDLDAVDFEKHPRFRDVCVLEATVSPGDFLLLPVGWWHTVRSLSPSISLSFQNFAVDEAPVEWQFMKQPLRTVEFGARGNGEEEFPRKSGYG
jgi:hypothetical protein